MRRLLALVLFTTLAGCNGDDTPATDQGPGREMSLVDGQSGDSRRGDVVLLWPDGPVRLDTAPTACTSGAAGMCDDNKNFYCKSGVCTACPASYVDCNRQEGDGCECFGACKGTQCAVKP